MNYWQLTLRDGEQVKVKPENVPLIKQKMDSGGNIHTATRSIPVDQIRGFAETDEQYVDSKQLESGDLLEGAAQAFHEPMIEGDSIMVKWVKKSVPMSLWTKHYSNVPAYKRIADDGNRVMVAFRLPVHQISSLVQECTPEDLKSTSSQLE